MLDPGDAEIDTEESQPPAARESSTRSRDGGKRSELRAGSRHVAGKRSVPARGTARKPAAKPSRTADRTKAMPQASRPPNVSLSPLVSATPRASTTNPDAMRPYPSDARERARWELEARQRALARIKQENLLAQKVREEEAARREREARAAQHASSSSGSGARASAPASASPAPPRASKGARRPAPRLSSPGGSSSSAPRPALATAPGSGAPDVTPGPLASAAPAREAASDARTPSSVIPVPENRARARAGGLVVGGGVGSAVAGEGQGDCLCRVRGTVEVRSQRPLERRVSVSLALEQARQASDAVELFMGSPREFELPRVPCGNYTLQVGMSPGRPALRVVSGDGSFRCVGVHQVRIILEPR